MCMLCRNESINYICNNCYKKYGFNIKMEMMPLDKHNLYVVSMLNKKVYFDYNYYQKEYSLVFNFFNNLGYHVLFFDSLSLEMEDIYILDGISKLVDNDILVMTFNIS